MYQYAAKVERVIDGDTIDVSVDLGFGIFTKKRLRIMNLDTPEKFGRASAAEKVHGEEASNFAEKLLENRQVVVHTYKDRTGKYGRYLASIRFAHPMFGDDLDFATIMKTHGFAKRESYE